MLVSLNYTKGGETNSITNNVIDGVMKSHLKVDYAKGSILFNETENGIYADPKLSKEESGISIEKIDDGIIAKIPLKSSGKDLKIDSVSYSEYLLKRDPDTLYFVTDKNRIIFNRNLAHGFTEFFSNLANWFTNIVKKCLSNLSFPCLSFPDSKTNDCNRYCCSYSDYPANRSCTKHNKRTCNAQCSSDCSFYIVKLKYVYEVAI